MSQAFVREGDDQWLSDVAPTLNALMAFLSRENNGIRVSERSTSQNAQGRTIHHMSNGLAYAKDTAGKWEIIT